MKCKPVDNLHAYAWGKHMLDPYDWAVRFKRDAKDMYRQPESTAAYRIRQVAPEALLLIPTPEIIICPCCMETIVTRQQDEIIASPSEGVDGGSIWR